MTRTLCRSHSRADSVYEDMKQRYGHQGCYLLKMNSRTFSAEEDEQIPDPWSQYLHRNHLQNQVSTVVNPPEDLCNIIYDVLLFPGLK